MFKRIRSRLGGGSEQGFTVIELLVVIIIIGILLAIAVPSYLGFRDRAANNTMKENLREALPAAEAYYADNGGKYTGMDAEALVLIDSGISPTLTVAAATASTFCLADTDGSHPWSVAGPGPSSADFKNNLTCA
jgi:type IV pilus assembly protein PilA